MAARRRAAALLLLLPLPGLLAAAAPDAAGRAPVSAADALRPLVRVLSRSVYVWHYVSRARAGVPAGYVPPDWPGIDPFLRGKLSRFWDPSLPVAPSATVSGLYAGIDPVAGRHFAGVGEGWAVVQIELPAGLRFLDVRPPAGAPAPLPRATRARLAVAGCAAELPESLVVAMDSAPCREIAVASLGELGAGAILADFPRFAFRECAARPTGVFVLLDPALLAPGRVRLLTRESAADAAQADRLRIRALFARARAAGSLRPLPWPELADQAPPPDLDAWMREHLLGCGGFAEDRPGEASAVHSQGRRRSAAEVAATLPPVRLSGGH